MHERIYALCKRAKSNRCNKARGGNFSYIQNPVFALKEPHGLSQGTITFRVAQAPTAVVDLGFGIGASIGSERKFFYQKKDLTNALSLRDYVSGYEDRKCFTDESSSGAKVVSVVDEIRALKGLLDDGILTQEEFDAKKRQLLGL